MGTSHDVPTDFVSEAVWEMREEILFSAEMEWLFGTEVKWQLRISVSPVPGPGFESQISC